MDEAGLNFLFLPMVKFDISSCGTVFSLLNQFSVSIVDKINKELKVSRVIYAPLQTLLLRRRRSMAHDGACS